MPGDLSGLLSAVGGMHNAETLRRMDRSSVPSRRGVTCMSFTRTGIVAVSIDHSSFDTACIEPVPVTLKLITWNCPSWLERSGLSAASSIPAALAQSMTAWIVWLSACEGLTFSPPF